MEDNYLEIIRKEFLIQTNSTVKYGSIKDGGYFLSTKHILEADLLFSGGISSNIEFEYDLFRRNETIKIVMVDPTVSKLKLLSKAIVRIFFFKKEKLRYLINTLTFIMMLRSGRCWHLKKWLSSKTGILDCIKEKVKDFSNKKIILKLDIEGSEYDLLEEITTNSNLFNCMIFEFHDLDEKHLVLYDFLKKSSEKFNLVHLEVNPSGGFSKENQPKNIEVTLERKM